MPIQHINPSTIAPPKGYSHVVKDGSTVYIAGQVARDRDGKIAGVGDAKAQAEQVFKNLEAALAVVKGNLSYIVKTNLTASRKKSRIRLNSLFSFQVSEHLNKLVSSHPDTVGG